MSEASRHERRDSNASEIIARARKIAPLVAAEADRMQKLGRLSSQVDTAFREAELYWMVLPKELRGGDLDLIAMMDVIEEVSLADGSAGWTLMACALNTLAPAAFGSESVVEEMFGGDRRAVVAGQFGPGRGVIARVDGGYRISGQFSFASGASHANWLTAGVALTQNGTPEMLPNGYPNTVIGWFRREDVEILENWDVIGLQATGSYDYRIPDQFLPAARTMEWTATRPLRGRPLYRIGIRPYGLAGHSAVMLGIAARALVEASKALAAKRRPGFDGILGDNPVFRDDFARHEAMFQGARSYLRNMFGEVQENLRHEREFTDVDLLRMMQAAIWGHEIGSEIARFCHVWAGSGAIYGNSALGRCMRDMHTATQHIIIDRLQYGPVARALIPQWGGYQPGLPLEPISRLHERASLRDRLDG